MVKQADYSIGSALVAATLLLIPLAGAAQDVATAGSYAVQAGDVLRISVWKEVDLQQELLVRPDGGLSFPLVGDVAAAGRTVVEIQSDIVARIEEYIPDPVVTVQVLQIEGHKIYVLGKVNRPGEFTMAKPLDVTQALAIAGGLATFANASDISILRRSGGGQQAIQFDYSEVEHGRALEQNILLQPGDVVVVP